MKDHCCFVHHLTVISLAVTPESTTTGVAWARSGHGRRTRCAQPQSTSPCRHSIHSFLLTPARPAALGRFRGSGLAAASLASPPALPASLGAWRRVFLGSEMTVGKHAIVKTAASGHRCSAA